MIDTKALRSRILDLAMQGKLTEQLDSDGTAEELYQQIQAEKQKLVKEGKIKKEKPLPEITADDIPFEIPSNWKWVYMGDIFQHNTGKALNSANTDGQLLEYITTSNVYWDRFELKDLKQMYFSDTEIEKCTIKKGDLLICEGGDIGRSAIWNNDFEMRIQNHLHRLRGFLSEINVKYYYFIMMLYKEKGMIDGRGIGLQGFSSKRVHSLIVPLLPLAEQKRIVERVEEIFRLLDTIDEAQEKYSADVESLRSKLITAGIQGRLTQQLDTDGTAEELYQQIQAEKQKLIKEGKLKKEKPLPPISPEEIPFEIPENWMWVRLQEIVTLLGDGIHGTPKYDENGEYYFINGNNLCNGVIEIKPNTKRIDYDEFLKYKKELNDNTVLVSINGTLGNLAFYNNEKVVLGKSACYFNLVKKEMKVYIYYLLKTDYFLKYANYTATGVTIRNVSLKAMNELLVPLPPLAEQKRIADVLERALGAMDSN